MGLGKMAGRKVHVKGAACPCSSTHNTTQAWWPAGWWRGSSLMSWNKTASFQRKTAKQGRTLTRRSIRKDAWIRAAPSTHGLYASLVDSRLSNRGTCTSWTVRALSSEGQSDTQTSPTRTLSKYFDWEESEKRIYTRWENEGYFKPNRPEADKFVMSMPPPNVTGALHMGHAMFVTIEDIMTRYARMKGKDVLWLPGTDHAGIATQMVVEKDLAAKGVQRSQIGREKFVNEVWQWKDLYGHKITDQLRRLGASCDWSRESFTLDENLSKAVINAFNKLHEEGLIYRGSYMVNWSPKLQTAVSDLEVEYQDETGMLYYFKYPIEGGVDFLPVATSRPETILGDTAVAVNPKDERFKHLIGKKAIVPFVDRSIPIIGDEDVDMEFGTGALKVTPAHDMNDYKMGKKHGLEFIKIMNKDGTLNDLCGQYSNLDRFAARDQLWQDMVDKEIGIRTEKYSTRVPKSQRGGEVIEPMVSEQWFVKMDSLASPALRAVKDGDIQIIPERFEKVYNNWLENIQDWCISRQLWWGHRIPAWYVYKTEEEALKGKQSGHLDQDFIVASNEEEAYEKAKSRHGEAVYLMQEEDVLDTWFSSSLWPFSTVGWPDITSEEFQRFYPTTILETGHDILFFWVARMIMMGMHLTGEVPFKTVYLHGLIRDQEGRKMSKTLGNVIDPLNVIKDYGTDALRFTLATGTTVGQDLNLSLDKIEGNRNFVNKIWNAAKFVAMSQSKLESLGYKYEEANVSTMNFETLPLSERWILAELANLIQHVDKAYERSDIGEAGRAVNTFFLGQFTDWYVEIAKTRLYSDDRDEAEQCMNVLMYVFLSSLKLLHPFMPFVTEEIWHTLVDSQSSIMISHWPEAIGADNDIHAVFEPFQNAIRSIRNVRAEHQVPVNKVISAQFMVDSDRMESSLLSESKVLQFLCKVGDIELIEKPQAESLDSEEYIESVVSDNFRIYIPVVGLVDTDQEIQRLRKQAKKIQKDLDTLNSRLSSPSFSEKAPKNVVDSTVAKRDEFAEQMKLIQDRLATLEGSDVPA